MESNNNTANHASNLIISLFVFIAFLCVHMVYKKSVESRNTEIEAWQHAKGASEIYRLKACAERRLPNISDIRNSFRAGWYFGYLTAMERNGQAIKPETFSHDSLIFEKATRLNLYHQ
jgi:hypothetical protein